MRDLLEGVLGVQFDLNLGFEWKLIAKFNVAF
jgi:hypothetical protein